MSAGEEQLVLMLTVNEQRAFYAYDIQINFKTQLFINRCSDIIMGTRILPYFSDS